MRNFPERPGWGMLGEDYDFDPVCIVDDFKYNLFDWLTERIYEKTDYF